jgi:hypothetical protein
MADYLYNEKRAAQAAAFFTKRAGGRINKYRLCKMMYYLERQTILKTGQPLFFDDLYSAPLGPVASEVNHGIDAVIPPKGNEKKNNEGKHPEWEKHFDRKGKYDLVLTEDPGDNELSVFNINMIYEIDELFEKFTWEELKRFFHDLPEYEKTDSNIPISMTDILEAEGFSRDEIEDLQSDYLYYRQLASL